MRYFTLFFFSCFPRLNYYITTLVFCGATDNTRVVDHEAALFSSFLSNSRRDSVCFMVAVDCLTQFVKIMRKSL
jgi:hypothetical protein